MVDGVIPKIEIWRTQGYVQSRSPSADKVTTSFKSIQYLEKNDGEGAAYHWTIVTHSGERFGITPQYLNPDSTVVEAILFLYPKLEVVTV